MNFSGYITLNVVKTLPYRQCGGFWVAETEVDYGTSAWVIFDECQDTAVDFKIKMVQLE